jgi:hypothetical protein
MIVHQSWGWILGLWPLQGQLLELELELALMPVPVPVLEPVQLELPLERGQV